MKQTIHDILEEFRLAATSNRDLGDKFERLICRYLELDPLYAERFSNVWMWNEWPHKGNVGDVGIDLVAEERATGEFCAIQCKFYLPDHTLSKADIDSFFTAAGKEAFTSCMIVSTTDKWGKNAEDALANQAKPITRLRVQDLDASPVDWSKFNLTRPQDLHLRAKKQLRDHQTTALQDVVTGLSEADRGKLIMACGTGKTFTALKIAEKMAPKGQVLFLVPSLSLLSQSLREWTAESALTLHSLAVCSDANIGKKITKAPKGDQENADITTYDLAFPATTSSRQILHQYQAVQSTIAKKKADSGMTVVFSTYQSIQAVSQAQKNGLPEFDLIICDEAHRTTGVTLSGEDESHFVKIHDTDFIRGKKRLYMTATPRIYSDDTKVKAKDADAELCSMDDPAIFGEELHRLGFGDAVGSDLLSDYKVLVLAVDEKYVSKTFQRQIADTNNEINLEDAVKITGCWNGLSKRLDQGSMPTADLQGDTAPMRRAVAFARSIKDSKAFTEQFAQIITAYRETHPDAENLLECELDHVDGTFNALKRNELLDWLKAESPENTCRILSNARCLSEGVDVPALDAVLFLNPRKSIVDVVQSVGRVMRKAEGKKYGYIILPIGIPADVAPEEALKDNEKYKVVWQVLQALRAHDDRFNATVNQIELNKKRPSAIQIIGVGGGEPGEKNDGDGKPKVQEGQGTFFFPQLDEWKDAIYAKIVLKCGDRRYWESWAKDVAVIAERHITRIKALLESGEPRHKKAFAEFLEGLQQNINPSISEDDAIEMLSQHIITRPVFDALFESYSFTQNNPVSIAMQKMLDTLEDQALEKETSALTDFYSSVRNRVKDIDNLKARQDIVIELYDKFFRTAFPKMAERLGIVYTPVEVVDFIVHSVSDVLQQEFNSSLGEKDVHIIDPFTGTGTFIVRLLQSGLIKPADLQRKYQHELHANEIILLAYYIAAINIEETFHAIRREQNKSEGNGSYIPFEGIVLTDTFQISENKNEMDEKMFPENNKRVRRQKSSPIRVVIGNPPYSAGQESENDSNKALKYPQLDERIRSTYAEKSSATLVKNLYDSYVRALRWASDRIAGKGIVSFVSNGSFIDGNAMDGLRASLTDEFSAIYVFNLRGNARTSGEQRRMEKGNVFGEGTRTPVAISLFIKNPEKKGNCELFYHDIGDYLSREDKLEIITAFQSVNGIHREKKWQRIKPNADHDWINLRDPSFEKFVSLGDKKDYKTKTVFENYSQGILTSRDKWCYSFSRTSLMENMSRMMDFYNQQVASFREISQGKLKAELSDLVEGFVSKDPKKISWSGNLKDDLEKGVGHLFDPNQIVIGTYRPFCKQVLYFDRHFNERVYQIPKIFPNPNLRNTVLVLSGMGATKGFSTLIADSIPNFHMHDTGQCFPLYLYEKEESQKTDTAPKQGGLDLEDQTGEVIDGYRRRSAITDAILADFRKAYEARISKEDIFYYVYGILHSTEYKTRFSSDLKKMLPRIPFTKETADFWRFSQAGRDLAQWHLNYETIEPYPLTEHKSELTLNPEKHYHVQKMTFGRKDKAVDKTTIIYNSHLTLADIPLEAYEYIVNGKPALEWIMERYQITVDNGKDGSGIRNDPNDWMTEHNDPTYLVNLIKRVTRVSLETMKIVKSLPALNERTQ